MTSSTRRSIEDRARARVKTARAKDEHFTRFTQSAFAITSKSANYMNAIYRAKQSYFKICSGGASAVVISCGNFYP